MAIGTHNLLPKTRNGKTGAASRMTESALKILAVVALAAWLPACSMSHSHRTAALQPDVSVVSVSEKSAVKTKVSPLHMASSTKARPVEAGWTKGKDEGESAKGAEAKAEEADAETDESVGIIGPNDPLEPMNRFVFAVNDAMDTVILKPVAVTYDFWMPEPLKNSIRNVLRNLATPVTLLNDVLQGDLSRAKTTVGRFVINSTIGFAGLGDPATEFGMAYHFEDFGQTLAVHGVGEGFYLVLPALGPSTLRHTVGRAVDVVTDPLTWVLWHRPLYYSGVRRGTLAVSNRAELLDTLRDLRGTSVDYYATLRSTYRQNRRSEINNGQVEVEELPDISDLD